MRGGFGQARSKLTAATRSCCGSRRRSAFAAAMQPANRSLSSRCVFFHFIGHLLFVSRPNNRDLVRRSRHSIQRERRGKRLLLDIARSEDRDLVWANGETRNFVLWQLPARI